MKTICKFGILFLVLASLSCQNDLNNNETTRSIGDITIADGWVKSPEWLAKKIDDIALHYQPSPETGEYPYWAIWVYSVEYNDVEYLYILDMLSSSACNYFTPSGDIVDPGSDLSSGLYGALEEARLKNGVLLWRLYDVTKKESVSRGR